MLEHDGDGARGRLRWKLNPDRYAEKGGNRKVDRHLDAAHIPAQHNAFAVQLDLPHPLVGAEVGGGEAQWEGEGVEPLVTARPRRRKPAGCCLTPQSLSPRRVGPGFVFAPSELPPDRCRKHAPKSSESA